MHIVINGWFAREFTTGSGQYLHQLLRLLPDVVKDHPLGQSTAIRFSILLPFSRSAYGLSQLRAEWPEVAIVGIKLPTLPENLTKLSWEQIAVPLAARRLQADLLWIPYWAAPLWKPCPVVVTVHDIIHRVLPAYHGGWLQRRYTDLVSATARRADEIITVSHAAARDIVQELRVAPGQVHAVYNGLNLKAGDISPEQKATVRLKYDLPQRFFLYLGGFDARKNVPVILEAYRRYLDRGGDPGVQLVIAGQLPEAHSAFTPDPQNITTELNLADHVQFCGYVEEEDKPVLLNLATVFCFPSLYEGFGLPVLEAMQAGTPVITSRQ